MYRLVVITKDCSVYSVYYGAESRRQIAQEGDVCIITYKGDEDHDVVELLLPNGTVGIVFKKYTKDV